MQRVKSKVAISLPLSQINLFLHEQRTRECNFLSQFGDITKHLNLSTFHLTPSCPPDATLELLLIAIKLKLTLYRLQIKCQKQSKRQIICVWHTATGLVRVDAALWHFRVGCCCWLGVPVQTQARGHGSQCRPSTCVTCAAQKSWRAGRALGHCWVLSSGRWPCFFRTSLGISAEVDLSHSKLIYPLGHSLLLVINYLDIFITTYCLGWEANKEFCVWHAGIQVLKTKLLWPFVKTKQPLVSPSDPFKWTASGHIFLCELLAQ